jgi:hypothetical protein
MSSVDVKNAVERFISNGLRVRDLMFSARDMFMNYKFYDAVNILSDIIVKVDEMMIDLRTISKFLTNRKSVVKPYRFLSSVCKIVFKLEDNTMRMIYSKVSDEKIMRMGVDRLNVLIFLWNRVIIKSITDLL